MKKILICALLVCGSVYGSDSYAMSCRAVLSGLLQKVWHFKGPPARSPVDNQEIRGAAIDEATTVLPAQMVTQPPEAPLPVDKPPKASAEKKNKRKNKNAAASPLIITAEEPTTIEKSAHERAATPQAKASTIPALGIENSPFFNQILDTLHPTLGPKIYRYISALDAVVKRAAQTNTLHRIKRSDIRLHSNASIDLLIETMNQFHEIQNILKDIGDADPDMSAYANEELARISEVLRRNGQDFAERATEAFAPTNNSVIVEILPEKGGIDNEIFVAHLYRMYTGLADKMNWKIELLDSSEPGHGTNFSAFGSVSLKITGPSVYRMMRFENGRHQRVGKSYADNADYVYTNSANVLVYPEPKETEFKFDPKKECEFETMRATGPGGQNVNKLETAVRITHKESGLVVLSRSERSQKSNIDSGIEIMRSRLYARMVSAQKDSENAVRRRLLGIDPTTKDRVDRRKYDEKNQVVNDRRSGIKATDLGAVYGGNLMPFIVGNEVAALENMLDEALESLNQYH